MGSPSIAPWTSAIKAVEQLFDAPASDLTLSDVRDMEASLYALMRGAPLPHADMEQLVWELKAPKAAAALCIRALQQPLGDPRIVLLSAATTLLKAVLKCKRQSLAPDTCTDASTLQQLQQAGLVQQLPALMEAAKENLVASSKAAAKAVKAHVRSELSSTTSSSSSEVVAPRSDDDVALVAAVCMRVLAWSCAANMLFICLHIISCSADDADSAAVCLQAGPAAVQLILAVFEASSRRSLAQQQAGPEAAPAEGGEHCQWQAADARQPQPGLLGAVLSPERGVWGTDAALREATAASYSMFLQLAIHMQNAASFQAASSSTAGSLQGPGQVAPPGSRQEASSSLAAAVLGPGTIDPIAFLCSPELQRCQALLFCVILMSAQAATPLVSTSSSSSSSSSSSRAQAAARQRAQGSAGLEGAAATGAPAAGQVGRVQHRAECSPGPGSQRGAAAPGCSFADRLFELLGVSRETVMRAAGFNSIGDAAGSDAASDALNHLRVFAGLHNRLYDLQARSAEQSSAGTQERHLLLSLLLLQWMDSLPSGHTDTEQTCFAVVSTAYDLCHLALRGMCAGRGVSQALAAPADAAGSADEGQPAYATEQQQQQQQGVSSQPQDQPPAAVRRLLVPPTQILAELLPLLVRLSQSRLQLLVQQTGCPPRGDSFTAADGGATAAPAAAATQQGGAASGSSVELLMQLTAVTCVVLLRELESASSVHPNTAAGSTAAAALLPASGAATAAAFSNLVPAGPVSTGHSVLHVHEVVAHHAADIVSCLEAAVRVGMNQPDSRVQQPITVLEMMHQVDSALVLALAAGLGSGVLRQAHSLLSTLQWNFSMQAQALDSLSPGRLKAAKRPPESGAESSYWLLMTACLGVAEGAALLLSKANQQRQQQQEQHPGLVASAAASLSLLPSLVIIGRCFLQVAAVLQPGVAPGSLAEQPQQHAQQQVLEFVCGDGLLVKLAATAQEWLQAHIQPLAAAGYGPGRVLQQLEQLLAALDAIAASSTSAGSTAQDPAAAVVQQLQLAGAALSSLPVPCLCNYPGCTNAAGLSELGLVSGRSCVCGGCRVAHYCGRSCQRSHWKQHKPVCAALAAAAVARGAGAAAEL